MKVSLWSRAFFCCCLSLDTHIFFTCASNSFSHFPLFSFSSKTLYRILYFRFISVFISLVSFLLYIITQKSLTVEPMCKWDGNLHWRRKEFVNQEDILCGTLCKLTCTLATMPFAVNICTTNRFYVQCDEGLQREKRCTIQKWRKNSRVVQQRRRKRRRRRRRRLQWYNRKCTIGHWVTCIWFFSSCAWRKRNWMQARSSNIWAQLGAFVLLFLFLFLDSFCFCVIFFVTCNFYFSSLTFSLVWALNSVLRRQINIKNV